LVKFSIEIRARKSKNQKPIRSSQIIPDHCGESSAIYALSGETQYPCAPDCIDDVDMIGDGIRMYGWREGKNHEQ
jgi:hypothetical protein